MSKRDIEALIEILELYLDYYAFEEDFVTRYARNLFNDLHKQLRKLKKNKKASQG